MKPSIRIASGQGYWGDWLEAPLMQVSAGPIDYLVMDYLAEVTMSIMQKQKSRDPNLGYAKDFIPLMEELLPLLVEKNVCLITNAGGVNPVGCMIAVRAIAEKMGFSGLRLAAVYGDDILNQIDSLIASGHDLKNMESGAPLSGLEVTAELKTGIAGPQALTGPMGRYTFTLAADVYDVTADAIGYLPRTITGVTVVTGRITILDFSLPPAGIYLPFIVRGS